MPGGYDDGYRACPCFWGTEPSSMVRALAARLGSLAGMAVLDAGCGEGKNAAFLARRGARVDAIDVSALAIGNGIRRWGAEAGIRWRVGDVRELELRAGHYDIVLAYGLLHCLPDAATCSAAAAALAGATKVGGHIAICALNDRYQELSAHPNLNPTLLPHSRYLELLPGFEIIAAADSDLRERHPHNELDHTHSVTRILARRLRR